MATLSHLGVTNLRSLRSIDPPVRIAPITVLLGRNSVGKSTFARIFPLLRQSAEKKKRSPILWFGDLVDFGSLGRSVTSGEKEIGLKFQIDIELPAKKSLFSLFETANQSQRASAEISISLSEDPTKQVNVAKNLSIKLLGGTISIDTNKPDPFDISLLVNGKEYSRPSKEHALLSFQGELLPLVYCYVLQKNSTGSPAWVHSPNHWEDLPTQEVRKAVHQNTSTATCTKIARQVPFGTVEEIDTAIQKIPGPSGWTSLTLSASRRRSLATKLHQALLVANATEIIQQTDVALSAYFKGVRYLKPLRATAERYYRRLDLSVSEIDPDGSNLPMFLDSLSSWNLNEFRTWLKQHLGIDAYPRREGDQVMVMAQGKNDPTAFNIADMGFGISQVLPIAAQLWATTRSQLQPGNASIVVIEQPELHLHPDSQARLADVFAGTVRSANRQQSTPPPSILIETHSQHLVNRLGQLIESKALSADDVSIILFEASGGTPPATQIRVSEFSESGVLQNWPYGFFEPETD